MQSNYMNRVIFESRHGQRRQRRRLIHVGVLLLLFFIILDA